MSRAEEKGAVIGVDEAGRGPLAGPVVAAAVMLPEDCALLVDDSKKLSASVRASRAGEIKAVAVAWSIGFASSQEIDEVNILNATMLAMARAVSLIHVDADAVLIDGNRVPDLGPERSANARAIIKGDALVPAISAASILAKVTRDTMMCGLDRRYPQYGFAAHMGYPTRQHLESLARAGVSPQHRRSFGPVRRCLGDEVPA